MRPQKKEVKQPEPSKPSAVTCPAIYTEDNWEDSYEPDIPKQESKINEKQGGYTKTTQNKAFEYKSKPQEVVKPLQKQSRPAELELDPWGEEDDDNDNNILTNQAIGIANKGIEDWNASTPSKNATGGLNSRTNKGQSNFVYGNLEPSDEDDDDNESEEKEDQNSDEDDWQW